MDITFLYEPSTAAERIGVRRRVLVSVVRGTIDKTIIGKTVASATKRTLARDRRRPGAAPDRASAHDGALPRTGRRFDQTYTRLAGTTLLWQRDDLLIRVEGDLPRARLIAIARSVAGA